jgi:hypothetical protein
LQFFHNTSLVGAPHQTHLRRAVDHRIKHTRGLQLFGFSKAAFSYEKSGQMVAARPVKEKVYVSRVALKLSIP